MGDILVITNVAGIDPSMDPNTFAPDLQVQINSSGDLMLTNLPYFQGDNGVFINAAEFRLVYGANALLVL